MAAVGWEQPLSLDLWWAGFDLLQSVVTKESHHSTSELTDSHRQNIWSHAGFAAPLIPDVPQSSPRVRPSSAVR